MSDDGRPVDVGCFAMANPTPLSSGLARVAAFFEFSGLKTGFGQEAIAYPLLKSLQGKFRDIPIAMWVLAGLFLLKLTVLK